MHRRSRAHAALLPFVVTAALAAAACAPSTLRIDPAKRVAEVLPRDDPKKADDAKTGDRVRNDDEVRLNLWQKGLVVRVVNTNSALYSCTLSETPVPVPEIDSLKSFLRASSSYISTGIVNLAGTLEQKTGDWMKLNADLNFAIREGQIETSTFHAPSEQRVLEAERGVLAALQHARDALKDPPSGASLAGLLVSLDSLINGPHGVRESSLGVIRTLQRMHADSAPAHIPTHARALATELQCDSVCAHLWFISPLTDGLHALVRAKFDFEREPERLRPIAEDLRRARDTLRSLSIGSRHRPRADSLIQQVDTVLREADRRTGVVDGKARDSLRARAEALLNDAEKVTAAAYATESLAQSATAAKSQISCRDTTHVSLAKGRDLKVTVSPKKLPELARLAGEEPYELKLKVLPRLPLTPSLNLALIRAGNAEYPDFGTSKFDTDATTHLPPDKLRVIQNGTQDLTEQVGLTLGLDATLGSIFGLVDRRQHSSRWFRVSVFPEFGINPSKDVQTYVYGGGVSLGPLRVSRGVAHVKRKVLNGQELNQIVETLSTKTAYDRTGYWSFAINALFPFQSK